MTANTAASVVEIATSGPLLVYWLIWFLRTERKLRNSAHSEIDDDRK